MNKIYNERFINYSIVCIGVIEGQDLWTKHTNKRFINYSIVCIGVVEVSNKDKIYEQNILTNV